MDKSDPPTSLGIFKPVGHTLVAFRTADDQQVAVLSLLEQGFAPATMVTYTAQEMMAQVGAELQTASSLASFGYELNLIHEHRALADTGCSFLVVQAPDDEQAERVAVVARKLKAAAAQRYGSFIIEDLSELTPEDTPVYESFARDAEFNALREKRR